MSTDSAKKSRVSTGEEGGELSRELGAPMLAVYGAGTILGAGIFVLIGKVAGSAGSSTGEGTRHRSIFPTSCRGSLSCSARR